MSLTDAIRGMRRFSPWDASRASRRFGAGLIAALHLAALAILVATEYGWFCGRRCSCCPGRLLNCAFSSRVLRRPAVAAALSLGLIALLVVLSQLQVLRSSGW